MAIEKSGGFWGGERKRKEKLPLVKTTIGVGLLVWFWLYGPLSGNQIPRIVTLQITPDSDPFSSENLEQLDWRVMQQAANDHEAHIENLTVTDRLPNGHFVDFIIKDEGTGETYTVRVIWDPARKEYIILEGLTPDEAEALEREAVYSLNKIFREYIPPEEIDSFYDDLEAHERNEIDLETFEEKWGKYFPKEGSDSFRALFGRDFLRGLLEDGWNPEFGDDPNNP